MTNFTLNDGETREIDLGNSATVTITNTSPGGQAVNVSIDRKNTQNQWVSAIKGSAGFGNPFQLNSGQTKVINKVNDLESEHVRVGVAGNGGRISVTY
jgi:hypothetical protein